MQVDFFVAEAVPDIYGKNVRLKNRGMWFFLIHCRALKGKKYLNDLDLHDILINQIFPRFSSTCFARKKAREIFVS